MVDMVLVVKPLLCEEQEAISLSLLPDFKAVRAPVVIASTRFLRVRVRARRRPITTELRWLSCIYEKVEKTVSESFGLLYINSLRQ